VVKKLVGGVGMLEKGNAVEVEWDRHVRRAEAIEVTRGRRPGSRRRRSSSGRARARQLRLRSKAGRPSAWRRSISRDPKRPSVPAAASSDGRPSTHSSARR
jgi:hypothetical protein